MHDNQALTAFCQQCDMIVNCTSPSSLYGSLIAETAVKQHKLYIDPSNLSGFEKDGNFLLSCGYMPGMSEFLIRWMSETYFDSVKQIFIYQGGTELCSPSAFADIILSAEHSGCGDAFLSNGKITPLKTDISQVYSLPFAEQPVMMKSFLSYDTLYAGQKQGAETIGSFNLYPDENLLDLYFRAIITAFEYNDREKASEKIKELVKQYPVPSSCFSLLTAEISGIKDDREKMMRSVIRTPDSAKICGFFLAECIAEASVHPIHGKMQGFEILNLSFWNKIISELKEISFTVQETETFSFMP